MKKVASNTLITILIGLFIYVVWIRPDYKWAQKIIEKYSKENWILVTQTESREIIKPWTLFKAPVAKLWFAKENDLLRIDSAIIIGHVLFVDYENNKTEGISIFEVFNSYEYGTFVLNKLEDLKTIDYREINWTKHKRGTPGGDLIDYYKSKNKKYSMLNIFGEEIDISNLILTGSYSVEDPASKYIFKIFNNNPYRPSDTDEKILQDGLKSWLYRKYPYLDIKLGTNLFESVKYSFSEIGLFNNIQDNYLIKVQPANGLDSILIEFDFPRFTVPAEYFKNDEIRIHEEN